jgi:hypothetical protein
VHFLKEKSFCTYGSNDSTRNRDFHLAEHVSFLKKRQKCLSFCLNPLSSLVFAQRISRRERATLALNSPTMDPGYARSPLAYGRGLRSRNGTPLSSPFNSVYEGMSAPVEESPGCSVGLRSMTLDVSPALSARGTRSSRVGSVGAVGGPSSASSMGAVGGPSSASPSRSSVAVPWQELFKDAPALPSLVAASKVQRALRNREDGAALPGTNSMTCSSFVSGEAMPWRGAQTKKTKHGKTLPRRKRARVVVRAGVEGSDRPVKRQAGARAAILRGFVAGEGYSNGQEPVGPKLPAKSLLKMPDVVPVIATPGSAHIYVRPRNDVKSPHKVRRGSLLLVDGFCDAEPIDGTFASHVVDSQGNSVVRKPMGPCNWIMVTAVDETKRTIFGQFAYNDEMMRHVGTALKQPDAIRLAEAMHPNEMKLSADEVVGGVQERDIVCVASAFYQFDFESNKFLNDSVGRFVMDDKNRERHVYVITGGVAVQHLPADSIDAAGVKYPPCHGLMVQDVRLDLQGMPLPEHIKYPVCSLANLEVWLHEAKVLLGELESQQKQAEQGQIARSPDGLKQEVKAQKDHVNLVQAGVKVLDRLSKKGPGGSKDVRRALGWAQEDQDQLQNADREILRALPHMVLAGAALNNPANYSAQCMVMAMRERELMGGTEAHGRRVVAVDRFMSCILSFCDVKADIKPWGKRRNRFVKVQNQSMRATDAVSLIDLVAEMPLDLLMLCTFSFSADARSNTDIMKGYEARDLEYSGVFTMSLPLREVVTSPRFREILKVPTVAEPMHFYPETRQGHAAPPPKRIYLKDIHVGTTGHNSTYLSQLTGKLELCYALSAGTFTLKARCRIEDQAGVVNSNFSVSK